jgi:hypothetical protein
MTKAEAEAVEGVEVGCGGRDAMMIAMCDAAPTVVVFSCRTSRMISTMR